MMSLDIMNRIFTYPTIKLYRDRAAPSSPPGRRAAYKAQIFTVLSLEAEAMYFPSGDTSTA